MKAKVLRVPPVGIGYTAYKKLDKGRICTLRIPPSAQRTRAWEVALEGCPIGKVRASHAKVVAIVSGRTGKPCKTGRSYHHQSWYDVCYEVGKIVKADRWDHSADVCSHGIHHFMTLAEARAYV